MDISIIGAAPSAGAQSRSSQSPAAGTDSFARHLQQAHAAAGDDAASSASPAAEAPARNSGSVAEPQETQAQSARPDDDASAAAADVQALPAQANATTQADTGANAEQAQPLDALDEIRRRLALIEQAGQLPGAESAAAIAPLQAAAVAAQAPGGSPLAATGTAERSPEPIASVAGASGQQALLQASTREASATGSGLPLAAQDPAAPGLAVDAAKPAQAGAEPGSDIAATPAVTSSLADAASSSTTTGNGLPAPSGMPPSGSPPGSLTGTSTLAGMAGTAAPSNLLAAPLASHEWQQDLGRQLIGLHQRGEQQVELHLHPSELGPLSVSLKLGELGAQAQFLSAHPQVRAAVEQAIPQLREALAAQGISLGETSVGAQHQPQGDRQAGAGAGSRQDGGTAAVQNDNDQPSAPRAPRALRGQVDLYA